MLWKDKYQLGVNLIDEQHKELFKRVEDFMKILRSSVSWEDKAEHVNETLKFMNGYVVEHFRDEEEYQRKIGYPGYEEHRILHKNMVDYILQATEEFERDSSNEICVQQIAGKLLAWLINHVASEDQRIAEFAIKKGVEGLEN